MDTLAFCVEPAAGLSNVFDVYWMVSQSKRGAYRCVVTADVPADQSVVAELSAIQYFLEFDQMLGPERAGNALTISVSSGAIRKLMLHQSKKLHLIPYSIFLSTRFSDADVSVGRASLTGEFAWGLDLADSQKKELVIDGPLPELVQIFGVGTVRLCVHAVDAYLNRGNAASRTEAWRDLRKMARDSCIRQLRLPADLVAKKLERWGFPAIDLYHRGTEWHFVVSDDEHAPRLLSMYQLKVARPDVVEFSGDSATLVGKTVLVAPAACFTPTVFEFLIDSLFSAGANIGLDRSSRLAVGEDRLARFKRTRPDAVYFAKCPDGERLDAVEFVRSVRRYFGGIHHLVVAGLSAPSITGSDVHTLPGMSISLQLVQAAKRDLDADCGVVLSLLGSLSVDHPQLADVDFPIASLLKNATLAMEMKCVDLDSSRSLAGKDIIPAG